MRLRLQNPLGKPYHSRGGTYRELVLSLSCNVRTTARQDNGAVEGPVEFEPTAASAVLAYYEVPEVGPPVLRRHFYSADRGWYV